MLGPGNGMATSAASGSAELTGGSNDGGRVSTQGSIASLRGLRRPQRWEAGARIVSAAGELLMTPSTKYSPSDSTRKLLDAANALHGPVDPTDFKAYIFPRSSSSASRT